jgi:hypothetical protein
MSAPPGPIACYISGHGFGHAARDVELLNALGRQHPDVPVAVRTSAPRWLFDLTLTRPVDWQPRECDTGVVQIDSLELDARATVERAVAFHDRLDDLAREEAGWLTSLGARLVVGDIPPLACAAAHAAGLPSIALGNFTWDWIYDGYRDVSPAVGPLVTRLQDAYGTAQLALRLPMHGGFAPFHTIRDLPLIARRSARDADATRKQLGLPSDTRLVLLSFGGYGLAGMDLASIASLQGYTVVTTADVTTSRRADDATGPGPAAAAPNVVVLDEQSLYGAGLRYEDLVAAVDVVMTKPGYGIISECVANHTALVYTSRGHFVEYDVLVHEMPRWLRTAFISNEDLLAGRWQDALDRALSQPEPPERIAVDGAARAAEIVVGFL